MTILSRYILKQHIAPFIFGSCTVLFVFIFQFILNFLDKLVGKGLDNWVILQLIVLNVAWMLILAVPMGILFSTLMAFGNMASTHEVTIIKASGGSLLKMMRPIIITSIIFTYFLFWFNDVVLPEANFMNKSLMSDIQRKKPTFTIEGGQFSTELEGYTIMARKVDSITGKMFGVTIYDYTKGRNSNIASADTGIVKFSPERSQFILFLYSGEAHQIVDGSVNNFRKILFKEYQVVIGASGYVFERTNITSRGDREMPIKEMKKIADTSIAKANIADKRIDTILNNHYLFLSGKSINDNNYFKSSDNLDTSYTTLLKNANKRISYIRSLVSSDLSHSIDQKLNAKQYEVEIHKKYAIPFACFIFALVGCPLGIMTKGGNFGISAAISLGFYILYWACLIGGEKLADRGLMTPFLSMWIGNFFIGLIGIVLTLRINNESFSFSILSKMNILKKFKK